MRRAAGGLVAIVWWVGCGSGGGATVPAVVAIAPAADASAASAVARSAPPDGPLVIDPPSRCGFGVPNLESLCRCLLEKSEEVMMVDATPACGIPAQAPALGSSRLAVVTWGTPDEGIGGRVHQLVARDASGWRVVAELGRDHMPGAFGIHNESTVIGGEPRTIDGREIVVVRSEVHNRDSNMAGLELCFEDVSLETVCAIGPGEEPTRCVTVPVSGRVGCGAGAEPDPADASAETQAMLDEQRKGWFTETFAHAWTLTPRGALSVRRTAGEAKLSNESLVGVHALFP